MSKQVALQPAFWSAPEHDALRRKIDAALSQRPSIGTMESCDATGLKAIMRHLDGLGLEHGGACLAMQAMMAECLAGLSSPAIATALDVQCNVVAPVLNELGTPEQVTRFLRPAAHGELLFSHAARPGAVAAREGDGWRLNGSISGATLASIADLHWLMASVQEQGGATAPLYFIVPANTDGIVVQQRGHTSVITLNNVRLDDRYRVGTTANSASAQQRHAARARILSAVHLNQLARRCLDEIANFLRVRVINGAPLLQLPVLQHRLAVLETEWAASRALAYVAVEQVLAQRPAEMASISCKLLSSRLLRNVSKEALQLGGVAHYRSDSPIAHHFLAAMAHADPDESEDQMHAALASALPH